MAAQETDTSKPASLTIGPREFAWGERTYLMGVINVSPESFWNGKYDTEDAALERGVKLVEEGADILDIGGQSTRPGYDEVPSQDEAERVAPVIERLVSELDIAISVDTYKASVAKAALEAGVHLLNDIWGFRPPSDSPEMAALAVEYGVPVVIMHNQRDREFNDVIGDVRSGLEASVAIAEEAGLGRERLIIDPGFGFGWTPEQNIEMLRRLPELSDIGLPMLVATSRKSTIGFVLDDAPPEERLHGTSATNALAIANGADMIRIHDMAEMRDVARVADAVVRGWSRDQ
jgi:dihydropteroate synthase